MGSAGNYDTVEHYGVNNVGRKIYIKKMGNCSVSIKGYTGDYKNLTNPNTGNLIESYNPNANSMMVMSDGEYWHLYYCG